MDRICLLRSGLLGQTYDGDGKPTHGKRDNYDRLDDGTSARLRRCACCGPPHVKYYTYLGYAVHYVNALRWCHGKPSGAALT